MPPKSKEAYYFSHDANSRNDIKITRMRMELGWEGYGLYWCIIELLREDAEHKIPVSSITEIAFQINADKEKVHRIIHSFGLFKIDSDYFYSQRLIRSMDQRKVFSEAGKKGMQNRWGNNGSGAPPLSKVS
jgi:hypothetical protein